MITVGVYGRIGSGKTEVTRIFAENGAAVISADQIGKDVVENDPYVLETLVKAFGIGILDSDGKLNRRATGRIAFSSPENRARLDSIVHPPLLRELRAQIDGYRKSGDFSIVVVDAALILNWGLESELDVLVCVTAQRQTVIDRLVKGGLSNDEMNERLDAQIASDIQASSADFVIENDGSRDELRRDAKRVFEQIRTRENTV
ncbi:MAG: dephospho-CoA kinase [Candidatus Zixiibacteriota bacterium]